MTHLESLTKKIHKHCPELLELTIGCEIGCKGYVKDHFRLNVGMKCLIAISNNFIFHYIPKDNKTGEFLREFRIGTMDISVIKENPDSFEVLGHPIRLEHVLRAMDSREYQMFRLTPKGMILDVGISSHDEPSVFWDLTKPLSGQTEETLKFLDEIIK